MGQQARESDTKRGLDDLGFWIFVGSGILAVSIYYGLLDVADAIRSAPVPAASSEGK